MKYAERIDLPWNTPDLVALDATTRELRTVTAKVRDLTAAMRDGYQQRGRLSEDRALKELRERFG